MDARNVEQTDWLAVQVWAGREQSSAEHLRMRGCEVFLPCYVERRRWSDRIKQSERALFAGYVFCRVAAEAAWQLTRSPGVVRVVGDGRHPLPVPGEEIAAIQRIVEARLNAEPWQFLQTGQRVRVETGPLRGTEGVLLAAKSRDRDRLVLSIPLLQRSVAVEVEASWLHVPCAAWAGTAARRAG